MRLTALALTLIAFTLLPERAFGQIPSGTDPGIIKRRFEPPLRPDAELYRCWNEQRQRRAKAKKETGEKPAPGAQPPVRPIPDDCTKSPASNPASGVTGIRRQLMMRATRNPKLSRGAE